MFEMKIKLGNDTMKTGADVADALRRLAELIEDRVDGNVAAGIVRDIAGNRVGTWHLEVPPSGK